MFDVEYAALGGDTFRALFGEAKLAKVLTNAVERRMRTEAKRDDEFRRAFCHEQAVRDIAAYLKDKRPQGAYRPDGILPKPATNAFKCQWRHASIR
jgi:hypothetical protein